MSAEGHGARAASTRRSARAAIAVALSAMLAFGPKALALGPLQRNHPAVERGLQAYEGGRYDEALRAFDEAKKELPSSAAVDFNRGNALYKLGRKDEAKDVYAKVSETERSDLKEKDYYNLGNAWAELRDAKQAIQAYRKALTLNPRDEDARHNLEVVLRNLPPPQKPDAGTSAPPDAGQPDAGDGGSPPDGGTDGGSGGDAGSDGGRQSGRGDGGSSDGGKEGGEGQRGDSEADAGTDAGAQEQEERNQDGGWNGTPGLSKDEVERMLDSMKQNEKNLQLWRFQQRKLRKPNEKDW
jgi:tetratricopeptide (TPR) repeat protein